MRAWILLGVRCKDDTLRVERHPCARRFPSSSTRFSCDCNIFRQNFTDKAGHLEYISVVHEVEGALLALQSSRPHCCRCLASTQAMYQPQSAARKGYESK